MHDPHYIQDSLSLRVDGERIPAFTPVTPEPPKPRAPKRRLQDARSHGIPEFKRCRDCDAIKSSDEFNRNSGSRDGLTHYCKSCKSKRHKQWWQGYSGKDERIQAQRVRTLDKKYGMTIDEYNARVIAQEGRCAICGSEPVHLAVDHDHDTGAIRDLLCAFCNTSIGLMRDNPEQMIAAANYLRKHGK